MRASAMLAPTEVLAEQHLRSVLDILGDMAAPEDSDADDSAAGSAEGIPAGSGAEPGRVRVRLLTASMGTRAKRKVLQELADGTAQIVIGTHALLSDEVSFHDLGLVVVDEQHRFGVEQRDSLRGTGGALPHRLVMTATPIPRTVAMTVFGDLDVSVLDTLPAARQKISTHVVPLAEKPAWASRLWRRAREEIDAVPGVRCRTQNRGGRRQPGGRRRVFWRIQPERCWNWRGRGQLCPGLFRSGR